MSKNSLTTTKCEPILVSACLLGLPTRYDGKSKRSQKVIEYLQREQLTPIPVCPEQLAGMTTPRQRTFFDSGDGYDVLVDKGRVVSAGGLAMNDVFCHGAELVLQIARLSNCCRVLLKDRSPSCGVHHIYCGDELIQGVGVTTALLINEGFEVLSEDDI